MAMSDHPENTSEGSPSTKQIPGSNMTQQGQVQATDNLSGHRQAGDPQGSGIAPLKGEARHGEMHESQTSTNDVTKTDVEAGADANTTTSVLSNVSGSKVDTLDDQTSDTHHRGNTGIEQQQPQNMETPLHREARARSHGES